MVDLVSIWVLCICKVGVLFLCIEITILCIWVFFLCIQFIGILINLCFQSAILCIQLIHTVRTEFWFTRDHIYIYIYKSTLSPPALSECFYTLVIFIIVVD
ncbi:hypothetical protein RND81_05G042900 [Saponaria officinalis]|uniref:Uncharacterized protein n=1 Tax=Saponaria officinalis TaxID=3572 RepID=A0AAW1KQ97_SAPOF